ncbi:hypothetical protein LJB88_01270 [Erysipelotrichaceae bacterium OttesenSCG-928-M19]|nr:hypothetical protein [Erysipelotrichaceae bacterium OttesenSCG-928-M19]
MKNYFALVLGIISAIFLGLLFYLLVSFLLMDVNNAVFVVEIFVSVLIVGLIMYAMLVFCCFKAYISNRKGFLIYPLIFTSLATLLAFIDFNFINLFVSITMLILAILSYRKAAAISNSSKIINNDL